MPPANPLPNAPRPAATDGFGDPADFALPTVEPKPGTTPLPPINLSQLGPLQNAGPAAAKPLPKLVPPPLKASAAPPAPPPLPVTPPPLPAVPPPLPAVPPPPSAAFGQTGLENWSDYSLPAVGHSKFLSPRESRTVAAPVEPVFPEAEGPPIPAPRRSDPNLGKIGPYKLKQLIGEGGMGLVYRAEDVVLKRMVALKVLKPELIRRDQGWKLFLKEAQATAALRDERIATIYQAGEAKKDTFYLAMELLQGENLETRLKRGRVPLKQALWMARETALGLSVAHDVGLVHRDIKPANLWLETGRGSAAQIDPLRQFRQAEPEYARLKILDFGLAQLSFEEKGRDKVVGTPGYMAPEQAAGKPGDARTDIFGLGVVLFRLVTGEMPFKGETSMELLTAVASQTAPSAALLNPQLPKALVELIQKMLCHDPMGRPNNAKEVARILEWIEKDLDQPPPVVKRSKRRPLLWAMGAGVISTVAFAAVWIAINGKKDSDPLPQIPPIPASGVLAPRDVVHRIGEEVTVEFTVGHMEQGEESTYLYESAPGEANLTFRAAVPQHLIVNMRRRGSHWPEALKGAFLRLEGQITREGKFAEMLVGDMDQFHKILYPEKPGSKPKKPPNEAPAAPGGASVKGPPPGSGSDRGITVKPKEKPDQNPNDLKEALEDFVDSPFGSLFGGMKPGRGNKKKPDSNTKPK